MTSHGLDLVFAFSAGFAMTLACVGLAFLYAQHIAWVCWRS